MLFCPECRSETLEFDGLKQYKCLNCDFTFFFNAATAVGALIVNRGKLLCGVRAHDPGKGMLDTPGGFVDPGESAEHALIRELEEELSLVPAQMQYLCSGSNRYHFKGVLYRTCDLYFICKVNNFDTLKAGDDLANCHWIALDKVQPEQFAFESAQHAIRRLLAMQKLR
jgi:ADP-ribose pyrophosphatase YjhB (NUDIX family)